MNDAPDSAQPDDTFDSYLSSTELLSELERKREELLQNRAELESRGHNVAALLASIDEHRDSIQQHLTNHELELEAMLQNAASRAENGRELFVAVAELIKALQRLGPEQWAQMPAEKQERWRHVLQQFDGLREIWMEQLTPEERQRLQE